MEEKRYSIVRVDMNYCKKCEHYYTNKDGNNDCRLRRGASFLCYRHGDTKEQMIQKILQAIIIDIVKTAKVNDKKTIQILYKANYKLAKFIVEFLGVK